MTETLSADEARRLWLRSQGLLGADAKRETPRSTLRRLGAVQLDTISVLARSHELIPFARLGAVGRDAVHQAWWGGDAFEYWAHAACVLPIEDWPLFEPRRERYRAATAGREASATERDLEARLAERPATASELGGAKVPGEWWSWSSVKVALERMLARGEVAVTTRKRWQRVYALAQHVVPEPLLAARPDRTDALAALATKAGAALGVATLRDIADYYRFKMATATEAVAATELVPVRVEGWDEPAWAHPGALAELASGALDGLRHRTTLLSPFDPLVWYRPRTKRVFGFEYVFEAYVPAAKRRFGYYAMPVLAGGRIVGQVDPKRRGSTLVAARADLFTKRAVGATAAALREAATWVGCDAVAVEDVRPPELSALLRSALGR